MAATILNYEANILVLPHYYPETQEINNQIGRCGFPEFSDNIVMGTVKHSTGSHGVNHSLTIPTVSLSNFLCV